MRSYLSGGVNHNRSEPSCQEATRIFLGPLLRSVCFAAAVSLELARTRETALVDASSGTPLRAQPEQPALSESLRAGDGAQAVGRPSA